MCVMRVSVIMIAYVRNHAWQSYKADKSLDYIPLRKSFDTYLSLGALIEQLWRKTDVALCA